MVRRRTANWPDACDRYPATHQVARSIA